LSAANTLRGGDTATGIVGVMTYTWAGNSASGNAFRVRPLGALNGSITFAPDNPRPSAAPAASGPFRVASMNVLNFFNTFGGACTNGVGGASTDCRGADNATEFDRQWPKTVAAIVGTNADVIGLLEVENDGYGAESAISFLVDRLNAATAPGTYAFIDADAETGQTNALGTDAIKVALVYKTGRAIPVGQTTALNTVAFVNGGDGFPRNRPSLAQAFEEVGTGARFVVSVNHLKSKGSACDVPDAGDGQGECNIARVHAANELTAWLATDPTGIHDPDVLIVGDLNAYAKEDPVTAIVSAGYTNVVPVFGGDNAYSYAFDGQWGSLDHALASADLMPQIRAAHDWFINADEPSVIDYNTDFKSAAQVVGLYAPDMYRMSDHNPLLIDLALAIPQQSSAIADAFGDIALTNSAGLAAGDPGSVVSFTLASKTLPGQGPGGFINAILRRTEDDGQHLYKVSTAMTVTALTTDRATGKATIVARCRLTDVTDPSHHVLIDADATLRVTLDDNAKPGALVDTVGVTVWNSAGQLWFSSNWTGARTIEQPIVRGDIGVR
jgi:predicted extracellular nuclease